MPYVQRAIESILAQTFREFEFVIIDDGSSDNTWSVLEGFAGQDARIRLFRNERNIGLPSALNKGLQVSRGNYIARADADDLYRPRRLARQVQFMDTHPDVGVLGAAAETINEKGHTVGLIDLPVEDCQIRFQLPFGNCLPHPSVVFRKDVVLSEGGYDEAYWTAQDYDLWARLLPKSKFANLYETLWSYRCREGSISSLRGGEGDRVSRTISCRLLSDYLGRGLSGSETEATIGLYRSWQVLSPELVRIAISVCREYQETAAVREPAAVVERFARHLAHAMIRQASYHAQKDRPLSLHLLRTATRVFPTSRFWREHLTQVARAMLPHTLCSLLKRIKARNSACAIRKSESS